VYSGDARSMWASPGLLAEKGLIHMELPDHTPTWTPEQREEYVRTYPAVGMSENLGILPGGYFAQLLAKRSPTDPAKP
jgi:hypothetical protein